MFKLFLFMLLLAPLPFGAYRPWAWSLFAVIFALIGVYICISAFIGRSSIHLTLKPVRYSLLLVLVPIGWAFLQYSTWVPAAWMHPFWQIAAQQLPVPVQGTISLDPYETGTALMKLLSYFVIFFISLQYNRDYENTVLTFKGLSYVGLVYAIYGLVLYLGKFDTLLWFDREFPMNGVASTFINRNSYATYAGLTLLASFPVLFDKIQSCFQYGLSSSYGRQYFFENVFIRGWLPVLTIIVISTALLLTQSRGGFLSTSLAVFSFIIVSLLSRKIKNNGVIMTLLGLVAAISWGVMARSGDKLLDRLDSTSADSEGRLAVYSLLSKANEENSWLGVGYGTFPHSFRLYRDETIIGFYDRAHNTYLENIFELGLLQASALFLAIALLAFVCLRGVWSRHRHWIYPAIGFSASLLVGAHALVDFSLQIPAVAYTYALMMGAAVAQSLPTRK